jgi:hypothetical protein
MARAFSGAYKPQTVSTRSRPPSKNRDSARSFPPRMPPAEGRRLFDLAPGLCRGRLLAVRLVELHSRLYRVAYLNRSQAPMMSAPSLGTSIEASSGRFPAAGTGFPPTACPTRASILGLLVGIRLASANCSAVAGWQLCVIASQSVSCGQSSKSAKPGIGLSKFPGKAGEQNPGHGAAIHCGCTQV